MFKKIPFKSQSITQNVTYQIILLRLFPDNSKKYENFDIQLKYLCRTVRKKNVTRNSSIWATNVKKERRTSKDFFSVCQCEEAFMFELPLLADTFQVLWVLMRPRVNFTNTFTNRFFGRFPFAKNYKHKL